METPAPLHFPIQDFVPMYRALEWRLSPLWWEARGQDAFSGGDVPYLVTSDGRLAEQTAKVFVEAVAGLPADGPLWVMELGAGSGLFARVFLLTLRDIAPDVLNRVRYLVADASTAMLERLQANGLLDEFAAQVLYLRAPLPGLGRALQEAEIASEAQWALVIANYVFDSLPATILRRRGGHLEELRLRTFLHEDAAWYTETGMEHAEILERLAKEDDRVLPRMLPLLRHLRMEARFEPVRLEDVPDSDRVPGEEGVFPHGFAALATLDELLGRLLPGGFFLLNDYAFVGGGDPPIGEFQRFGGSSAVGLCFKQMEDAAKALGFMSMSPRTPDETLPARLMGRSVAPAAIELFYDLFGVESRDALKDPLDEIARLVAEEQIENAADLWRNLLQKCPRNWHLHEQAAVFFTHQAGLHEEAIQTAHAGLAIHPCSALLWDVLGDAFLHVRDLRSASECYEKAIAVYPGEVRGRLNLAALLIQRGRPAEALVRINEAFLNDLRMDYSEDLLARQQEAVELLLEVRKQEASRMQERIQHLP